MKKNNLVKNTLILSICTILNKGLMFIMIPFFTRWLSIDDYGTYDVLATYVSLLIPFITLATNNAVFRLSVDTEEEQRKKYIANGFYIVTFNLIIACLLLFGFNIFLEISSFYPFLILLFAEVLDIYFQGYLRACKKLSFYGLCKTITVVFTAILVTLFVRFLGLGLNGMILGYSLGYFASTITIIIKTRFFKLIKGVKCSKVQIKELISYSWALIPNDIAWWIINVSDRQIINIFLGAGANGIYALACKIPNLCSSVFSVFNISWQEDATEVLKYDNKEGYYNDVLNVMIRTLISICIPLIAATFVFFDFIFDSRYSTARLYSPILVVSIIFSTLSLFYGGIQISLKRTKANGISTIIGAIVNLFVHFVLIKFIGLYAATVSTLISNVVVMYTRKMLLLKDFKFKIDNKIYIFSILVIYYSLMAMLNTNIILNLINLIIACFIFVILNRKLIYNITKKLISKIIKNN